MESTVPSLSRPTAQMVDPMTGQLIDIPVEGQEAEGTGEEE